MPQKKKPQSDLGLRVYGCGLVYGTRGSASDLADDEDPVGLFLRLQGDPKSK